MPTPGLPQASINFAQNYHYVAAGPPPQAVMMTNYDQNGIPSNPEFIKIDQTINETPTDHVFERHYYTMIDGMVDVIARNYSDSHRGDNFLMTEEPYKSWIPDGVIVKKPKNFGSNTAERKDFLKIFIHEHYNKQLTELMNSILKDIDTLYHETDKKDQTTDNKPTGKGAKKGIKNGR